MINEDFIKKIVQNHTLLLFQIGCEDKNFKILNKLPTDISTLMKDFNLTKMSVNVRVNKLEKLGLVKREKGSGKIFATELTPLFLELIKRIENEIEKNLPQYLG